MTNLIDAQARLTLSLLKDYLNRLENEMEGEVIWEDRPYAERVEQAIVDTKDIKAVLEALLQRECKQCGEWIPHDLPECELCAVAEHNEAAREPG